MHKSVFLFSRRWIEIALMEFGIQGKNSLAPDNPAVLLRIWHPSFQARKTKQTLFMVFCRQIHLDFNNYLSDSNNIAQMKATRRPNNT